MHRYVQGSLGHVAAGVDLSEIPNYADSFRLLTLRAELTTSAAVANRYAHFQFVSPSGNVLHEIVAQSAQVASSAIVYDLVAGSGSANEGSSVNDNVSSLPLPDFWLPAGTRVRTLTTALGIADQWSNVYWSAMVGEEWAHLRFLEEIAANLGG